MSNPDKVNSQAAALDILRAAIFTELQESLRLQTQPWEMPLLRAKLESAFVSEGFDHYAARVRKAMDNPDLKDYKIELYLRHFVMEPLLEANYLKIVQTLKDRITSILLPQFPLTTVVLEPNAPELYGTDFAAKFQDRASNGTLEESAAFRLLHSLGMESLVEVIPPSKSQYKRTTTPSTFGENALSRALTSDSDRRGFINAFEYVLKPISSILLNLSVLASFESLVLFVGNSVKHLESVLRRSPESAALEQKNLQTHSYAYAIMEYNCGLLLDLAMVFAKSTFKKYGIYQYCSPTQFQNLEREMVKFIRQSICDISKVDRGLFNPAQCVAEFDQTSRKVWLEVKTSLTQELKEMQKKHVYLPTDRREKLAQQIRESFRDKFMNALETKFGFRPRSEILVYNTFEKVSLSCQKTFEAYYSSINSPPEEAVLELEFLANEFLTATLQPDPKEPTFKCFPRIVSSKFPPSCVLDVNFRRAVVLASLYARLQASPDMEHTLSISRLARDLDMHEDPQVSEALEWSKTPTNLDQFRLDSYRESMQQLSQRVRDLDMAQIGYLLFSLSIFTSGRERDVHELMRAVKEQDIANLTPISIPRRKALIEVARVMNNGEYPVLNYQMILMLETVIEKRRIAHNRYIAIKVLKKPPSTFYVAEYSSIFTAFQQMYPKDIADLIVNPKSPSQAVTEQQNKFSAMFIDDVAFQIKDHDMQRSPSLSLFPKTSRPGGPSSLPAVDEDLTIAQATESALLDSYPQNTSFPPVKPSRSLIQSQQSMSESTYLGRLNDERDLKVLGKLQYMKDTIARLDFQHLPSAAPYAATRSRSPVICLSGFLCEDSDIIRDWSIVSQSFPFTETIAVHWESVKGHKSISNYWTAAKSVTFKTLTQFVIESLNDSIPRQIIRRAPSPQVSQTNSLRPNQNIPSISSPPGQGIVPKIALPKPGGDNQMALSSDPSNPNDPGLSSQGGLSFPETPDEDIPQESGRGTETLRMVPSISLELREQFRYSDIRSWKRKKEQDPLANLTEENVFDQEETSTKAKIEMQDLDVLLTQQVLLKAALQSSGRSNLESSLSNSLTVDHLTPEVFDEAKKYLPALGITSGACDFCPANPISRSKHHAIIFGQLLALMVGRANLFNKNVPNLCSFSLGSVVAHSLCCALYDLSCPNSVGDLLLMGSCIDLTYFGQNIHKLIGSAGVVQGKITILYSDKDGFLNYLVRSSRVAEQPIGLRPVSIAYLCECLKENDPDLRLQLDQMGSDLQNYVFKRIDIVNMTDKIVDHLDYMQNLKTVLGMVDFIGDLRYFKHHSR